MASCHANEDNQEERNYSYRRIDSLHTASFKQKVAQPAKQATLPQKSVDELGPGQDHLAIAGGSTIRTQKQ
jgi:hypothetical protein